MKTLLFKTVNCSGYLQKIKDGKFIDAHKSEGYMLDCTYMNGSNPYEKECEYCGDLDFLKTYFKYTEKTFKGIVVGIKEIVLTGYLIVDTGCDWNGSESTELRKQPKEKALCAIVYYGNNRKRYVPIEKLQLAESEVE